MRRRGVGAHIERGLRRGSMGDEKKKRLLVSELEGVHLERCDEVGIDVRVSEVTFV